MRGASLALAETRTQANRVAITSDSTLAQVKAEYRTCSDYDLTGDAAKARRFIVACRYLLALPKRSARESESLDLNPDAIQKQHDAAIVWLDSQSGGVSGSQSARASTLCALGRTRW